MASATETEPVSGTGERSGSSRSYELAANSEVCLIFSKEQYLWILGSSFSRSLRWRC
jgi:hypothetical protein